MPMMVPFPLAPRDDDEPEKTKYDRRPIKYRLIAEKVWIESFEPGGKSKEELRRNPKDEDHDTDEDAERRALRPFERILRPETDQEQATDDCLERIEPELAAHEPDVVVDLVEKTDQCE